MRCKEDKGFGLVFPLVHAPLWLPFSPSYNRSYDVNEWPA